MGASKQRAGVEPSCDSDQLNGSALAIYLGTDKTCTHLLRRPSDMFGPSLISQLTANKVGHVDGSDKYPIKLPDMAKSNAEAVAALLTRDANGKIMSWEFGNVSGRKRLSVQDGMLTMLDEYLSDMFDGGICEADCADVESALGVKLVLDQCVGEPDKIRWQICRIPTCCCAEAAVAETCDTFAAFDAVLEAGEVEPAEEEV